MARLPSYDTKLFCDLYDNAEDFLTDYKANGLYVSDTAGENKVDDAHINMLFYLLYSQHANDPIANYDENQFKYKMWAIIFQYGPSWVKKLDIQAKLRGLSEAELMKGSNAIFNHAYNPSTEPSTQSTTELTYINEQNVNKYSKAKVTAYADLWDLLRSDVTSAFIGRFQPLFKQFVRPEKTWIYVTDLEDEEDDE